MESQPITITLDIPCPRHPSEILQRVAMNKNADHDLYCLECIVQQKSKSGGTCQILKPISELVDAAASLYAQKRKSVKIGDQIPYELLDILSEQNERLQSLTQKILEEKKRVSDIFDSLTEEFLKIIEEKKVEALYKLDQQIFNLQFLNVSFEKQLKKIYPTPDDIPLLYPTEEDLIAKLAKITNAIQLTSLVKGLKEDLNETTPSPKREVELKKITASNNMIKQLHEMTTTRLSWQKQDFDLQKLKKSLREKVSDLLKQTWVTDATTGFAEESSFLKHQDFDMIKSWLPQNLSWSPKLLYRGSRDGMDGPTFHKSCDGKENTITVIKAVFQEQDAHTISVFGGFLDKAWHSKGGFIPSNDSFLFSITKNVKCPLVTNKGKHAASGNADQGPCFGGGYDIGLWTQEGKSFVYPNSYQRSNQLIEGFVSQRGQVYMDVLEVEVYTVN